MINSTKGYIDQNGLTAKQFVQTKQLSVIRLTFMVAAFGIFFIFLVALTVQQLLSRSTLIDLASDFRTLSTIAVITSFVSLILYFVTAFKLRNPNTSLTWFWALIITDVISYGITLGILLTLATTFSKQVNFEANDIVYAFLGASLVFGSVWGLSALPSQKRRYQQTQTLFHILLWAFVISIVASLLSFILNFTVFASTTNLLDRIIPGLSLIVGGIFSLISVYFVSLQIRNEQDLIKYYESEDYEMARRQSWRSALFFGAWLISSFMNLVYFILRIILITKNFSRV
ncbi:MPN455 family protein [Mycoplasmoides genitalium]|uniref:MPN455 family protein n=1 Tax=Mycoplasmoides genitalium TaxID=2097 RepID=UPI00027B3C0C|nr:hypothetical protein [Mycoplasmoides genitalium]AFQ03642.1 hypothetical protein CM3_02020 [Mycoplasmoides genitalium M6282]AFQ04650.1 hypothetical protein CM5_01890 [Mycoplasmoides genitalium M2288]